jgi:RNA polymerase sigma factor (sigma-70 family)
MATRDENLEPTAASLSSAEFVDGEKDERFALHLSEDLEPVALKDWTAKDFANIYVRFRPHLERHAKKYLSNPSQVDEVVQDAFLYLMTSLPELDSELGVLRFLKWKTKMLALDVIRAGARAPIQVDSEVLERSAGVDNRDLNEVFERADDAAIVNLAFSKLSTRHREALVAAVYEEKSYEQAAQEMGLSENAFRQLLFRARSAFKKSLVGEAETAGLSVSQILSIAARKAASGSGKYIGSVGVLLLVLALTIPGQFGGSSNVPQEVAGPAIVQEEPSQQFDSSEVVVTPDAQDITRLEAASAEIGAVQTEPFDSIIQAGNQASLKEISTDEQITREVEVPLALTEPVVKPESDSDPGYQMLLDFAEQSNLAGVIGEFGKFESVSSNKLSLISRRGGDTLTADIVLDHSDLSISYLWLELALAESQSLVLVPQTVHQEISQANGRKQLNYTATDFLVGDLGGTFGQVAANLPNLRDVAVHVAIELSDANVVESAELSFILRSYQS